MMLAEYTKFITLDSHFSVQILDTTNGVPGNVASITRVKNTAGKMHRIAKDQMIPMIVSILENCKIEIHL